MKKRRDQLPPISGEASLEIIIKRIVEVLQATSQRRQTTAQKQAAQILSRCLVNRYAGDHPSPFGNAGKVDSALEASQLWISGDLAIGRGGPEFIYVYLPTRFVADLLAEAFKVTSAPIKFTSRAGKEGKFPTNSARRFAETFATAGTVYLLNNLRAKLDEAIEDLFMESRVVVEELYRTLLISSLSELNGKEGDPVEIGQSRFTAIIKRIVAKGDQRRRKRLRAALWEIARGRGRPKGSRRSGASKRFSKKQFLGELDQEIRELSRTSDSNLTRKEVAKALGLSNEKALDRIRRQFGDSCSWRARVAKVS